MNRPVVPHDGAEPLAALVARTLDCTPEKAAAVLRAFDRLVPEVVKHLGLAAGEAVVAAFMIAVAWHLDAGPAPVPAPDRKKDRAALRRAARYFEETAAGYPFRHVLADVLRLEAERIPPGRPGPRPGREVTVLWPAIALAWRRVKGPVPIGRTGPFADFVDAVHEALDLPPPNYEAPHENAPDLNLSAEAQGQLAEILAELRGLYGG